METVATEQENVASNANLSRSIEGIQNIIDDLSNAREKIVADPRSASVNLAKLQNETKKKFDKVVHEDLKAVYNGLGKYSKVLDRKFKDKPLPTSEYDALSSHPGLINRAIAMHLLREGQFSVASTFVQEAAINSTGDEMDVESDSYSPPASKLGIDSLSSEALRKQFADMHNVLGELRNRNLLPAIDWARANSKALETRGSNLEFELGKLQFIHLFLGGSSPDDTQRVWEGQHRAMEYARQEFAPFQTRYLREIQQLVGAMAFCPNLKQSPYRRIFCNDDAWDELGNTFMREFCSLLGLSADSPLYIAATAGAIALPTLLKLQTIMKEKRTEWTTQHELPVEIPLPPAYHFHSIFVCPISKEQATDENPPMMMPCGHVIAHESLSRHAKGSRFKCPYCPNESHPREARKIIF